jgi:hypothetical protein
MDISGTAKKVQRATKVAEESYKKMQVMIEKMQEMREEMKQLQSDMETTSNQVDGMEHELAEQRALLEALANEQGVDVEEVLASVDIPERAQDEGSEEETEDEDLTKKATSKPSAGEDA